MRFNLSQYAWFGVALGALALAPAPTTIIIANHLASKSPSGVQLFLAYTPEQGEVKATTQLCWNGERGLFAKSFRLTSLDAFNAAGNAVNLHAILPDSNHAAWREATSDPTKCGDTLAFSLALETEPTSAVSEITKIYGMLELKLGKSVIRIPPESREKNKIAQSSLLQGKGFKLSELGEQQRFNLQFIYSADKKGLPPTLFLLDGNGKPFYSSKPRPDGLFMVKVLPTDTIPADCKIRIGTGTDKSNLIPDAENLFQSKELLGSALSKRGIRLTEFNCHTSNVFTVEITKAPENTLVPELLLDISGERIKGQKRLTSMQQDPMMAITTVWSFEIPAEFSGKRPDILVLLPGDEGSRTIPFEFQNPFAQHIKSQ